MSGKSFSESHPYGVRKRDLPPRSLRLKYPTLEKVPDNELEKVGCLPRDTMTFQRNGSRRKYNE